MLDNLQFDEVLQNPAFEVNVPDRLLVLAAKL